MILNVYTDWSRPCQAPFCSPTRKESKEREGIKGVISMHEASAKRKRSRSMTRSLKPTMAAGQLTVLAWACVSRRCRPGCNCCIHLRSRATATRRLARLTRAIYLSRILTDGLGTCCLMGSALACPPATPSMLPAGPACCSAQTSSCSPSLRVFIWRFAAFIFIEIYDF